MRAAREQSLRAERSARYHNKLCFETVLLKVSKVLSRPYGCLKPSRAGIAADDFLLRQNVQR
jgi:hypothetical protein